MFDNQNKLEYVGWKLSYKLIKKKAMDQELSWTGLAINLSIAFFIVAFSAAFLNVAHHSIHADSKNLIEGQRLIEAGALVRSFIPTAQAASIEPVVIAAEKNTYYTQISQGQTATQTIRFKNNSKRIIKASELSFETGPALRAFSKFKSDDWISYYQPFKIKTDLKPGQSVDVSFPLKAPTSFEGMVQENFQLVINERPVSGSLVRVFITVVKPGSVPSVPSAAPAAPVPSPTVVPVTPEPAPVQVPSAVVSNLLLSQEPILRIGLFNPSGAQRVTFNGLFDVIASAETLFSAVPTGQAVSVTYDPASRRYAVTLGAQTKLTASPIRFVPRLLDGVSTLLDYKNGPTWNPSASDNRFRGIIEYRYVEPAKKIWFINELGIETYLKGMAETSNAGALEYQKVMATAARSYAVYHYMRGLSFGLTDASTKHAADHFHIDSYYDQVYRGYNSEIRMPRLSAAVDATRGVSVTYQGKPVVTPYFSNSDGRTRDWTEVWGGSAVPWLKSVVVPYDAGKSLYGHGVGLSARGAVYMVDAGQDWQSVLKYFYSGIELLKIY